MSKNFLTSALCVCAALSLSACSVLIGNIKPVSERSANYKFKDLASSTSGSSEWTKLDAAAVTSDKSGATPEDVSDIAFQSKKTAAIISINSTCRSRPEGEDPDLKTYTNSLLLGISPVVERTERQSKMGQIPVLDTILTGFLNGESVKIRAVVLKKQDCLFDIMYFSKTPRFAEHEITFEDFVKHFGLN